MSGLHKYILKLILFAILIIANISHAQNANKQTIDTSSIHRFIDTISIQLSVVTPSYEVLEDAIKKLTEKKEEAEVCIRKTEEELAAIAKSASPKNKEESSETPPTTDTANSGNDAHSDYLITKKNQVKKLQSECKLIALRANEAIETFSAKAKELATNELLEAEASVIDNILHLRKSAALIYDKFNFNLFYLQLGIDNLNLIDIISLLLFMLLGYFTGMRIRQILRRRIHRLREKPDNVPFLLSQAALSVMAEHTTYILQACFIAAYFSVTSIGMSLHPLGVTTSFAFLAFILYTGMIRILFSPPKPSKPAINIAPEIRRPLIARLKTVGLVLCLAYIVQECLKGQQIPSDALQLPITIFVTILSFNLISILWLTNRIKIIRSKFNTIRVFINTLLSTVFIGILITNWIGLSQLSIYLLSGIAFSLICITIFIIVNNLIKYFFKKMSSTDANWQKELRRKLGLKPTAMIPELIWIRLVALTTLWFGLLLVLLKIWKLSSSDYQKFLSALLEGFQVASFEIFPLRIITSLLFFSILVIATRWLKTFIINKYSIDESNKGTVLAFATMLGYVGFILSFVFALVIAGVNFSGLALIFGALSVGIGFGLQNIVNNFVSGLILLIERPIKVGDRIIVSNIEGVVANINIRSTQVRTIKQYDVIVPNSELVSGAVTNLVFGDYIGKIYVPVGVQYGSDMQKVRRTLAKVADAHEDVISDTIDVLMMGFGDNSVNFELRCTVSDVNKHIQIKSDLLYATEVALKEAGIKIPFPQRDLHFISSFKDNIPEPPKEEQKAAKVYADEPQPQSMPGESSPPAILENKPAADPS